MLSSSYYAFELRATSIFNEQTGDLKLAQKLLGHSRIEAPYCTADSFVFCKPDGSPLHPDVLRKDVLYPVLDRLGIERIKAGSGFHCFRHSAGSFVNSQTGNLKLAQELLGHSSFGITADIYTHVGKDGQRDAASAVEREIFGDLCQSVPEIDEDNSAATVN